MPQPTFEGHPQSALCSHFEGCLCHLIFKHNLPGKLEIHIKTKRFVVLQLIKTNIWGLLALLFSDTNHQKSLWEAKFVLHLQSLTQNIFRWNTPVALPFLLLWKQAATHGGFWMFLLVIKKATFYKLWPFNPGNGLELVTSGHKQLLKLNDTCFLITEQLTADLRKFHFSLTSFSSDPLLLRLIAE